MRAVANRWLIPLFAAAFGGCAVITTLDHPAAQIRLTDTASVNRSKVIWFSPVDFFDQSSKDVARVCGDRKWRTSVDEQGTAVFEMRTSSHWMNFLDTDSMSGKMDKMNRGFAVCIERTGGGVEYLTTVDSGDMMFSAGARLRIDCRFAGASWTCRVAVNE